MIKVERCAPPEELTEEVKQQLTALFLTEERSVWNENYIRKKLAEMSYNKCVYCECNIGEESKYMEVDHFLPKHKPVHQHLVVEWSNLLPSCKRCNGRGCKGTHDPAEVPIINPTDIDPKNHLYLKNYRIEGRDKLGETTVKILKLNDLTRIMPKRKRICDTVEEAIADLLEETNARQREIGPNSGFPEKIQRKLKNLLKQAIPESEYAATTSSALLNNPNFTNVKNIMIENHFWTQELEELFRKADSVKYEVV